ncbi:MAG: transglycosylase SLT domain-containing protein [Burkholderiales bacterium]|nr:transglycosylase SLT domain-containing protein [Burkholderiales bacterium]
MRRRLWLSTMAGLACGLPQIRASALESTFASEWGAPSRPRRGSPAPLPAGYAVMGQRFGIPPMVLYGVALQESAKLFGACALPWPWTLNVRGTPMRYPNYAASVAAMRGFIAAGIRNVDAGLMQVNWGYHRDKLIEPARALDPYPNIAVGAQILRSRFAETRHWYTAVGRYHAPGDPERAAKYSALVYRLIAQVPMPAAAPLGASRG